MVGQSVGSMVLAVEALLRLTPDVFVDTTGFAFTYPVAKLLAGCRVATYTHYPTITTVRDWRAAVPRIPAKADAWRRQDMVGRVIQRRPSYNNDERVTGSLTLSTFKLMCDR